MKLSDKEINEEIKRIEERSLFFLKSFSLIWFTLIFFIIKGIIEGNNLIKIPENIKNILINNHQVNFEIIFTIIGFSVIGVLTIGILYQLSKNISLSIIEFNNKKELLTYKLIKLKKSINEGFTYTIFLIFFISSLYFLDNQTFTKGLLNIIVIFYMFSIGIIFLITPIISFFKNYNNWGKINKIERLAELSIITFIIYIMLIGIFFGKIDSENGYVIYPLYPLIPLIMLSFGISSIKFMNWIDKKFEYEIKVD